MTRRLTRRSVVAGSAGLGSTPVMIRRLGAAEYRFVQYHNQVATGALHQKLVTMWDTIRTETNGRVEASVYP